MAHKADQIDSYVQRFSKGINIAIYPLVTVVGTWSTYQWVVSQIMR